jgi:hypothetical protein
MEEERRKYICCECVCVYIILCYNMRGGEEENGGAVKSLICTRLYMYQRRQLRGARGSL